MFLLKFHHLCYYLLYWKLSSQFKKQKTLKGLSEVDLVLLLHIVYNYCHIVLNYCHPKNYTISMDLDEKQVYRFNVR